MKKFLLLTALTGLFSIPALAQTTNLFSAPQSALDKQREADANQQQYNSPYAQSSQQSYDYFNFGQNNNDTPSPVNQYGSQYKKNFARDPNAPQKLLPGFSYVFSFIDTPQASPDQATLRFITPLALSGCMHLHQPMIKIQEDAPSLNITITDEADVVLDKTVRYAHFQCDVRRQFAEFYVPLSRDELVANGITKIMLRGPNGTGSRTLDVHTDDNKIEVLSSDGKIATWPPVKLLPVNE